MKLKIKKSVLKEAIRKSLLKQQHTIEHKKYVQKIYLDLMKSKETLLTAISDFSDYAQQHMNDKQLFDNLMGFSMQIQGIINDQIMLDVRKVRQHAQIQMSGQQHRQTMRNMGQTKKV